MVSPARERRPYYTCPRRQRHQHRRCAGGETQECQRISEDSAEESRASSETTPAAGRRSPVRQAPLRLDEGELRDGLASVAGTLHGPRHRHFVPGPPIEETPAGLGCAAAPLLMEEGHS